MATSVLDVPVSETQPLPRALVVRSWGLTHRGKVREQNEDQFLIATLTKALQIEQTSLPQPPTQVSRLHGHLYIVADGMGGHAAGEEASALAIATVEGFVLDTLKWFCHLQGQEGDAVLDE